MKIVHAGSYIMDTIINNVIFKERESCTLRAWECGVEKYILKYNLC